MFNSEELRGNLVPFRLDEVPQVCDCDPEGRRFCENRSDFAEKPALLRKSKNESKLSFLFSLRSLTFQFRYPSL